MAQLGAVPAAWCVAATARAPEPQPIVLADLPLLFADDSGIAERRGVTRTVHPGETRKAPVLEPDRPWEGCRVYLYGSVYFDETEKQLQMWYMGRPEAERSAGKGQVSGLRNGKSNLVLYAVSRDGEHWLKPSLGLHACDGSTDNNIVFDLHSPSVLRDLRQRDPAKRYKMLGAARGNYHAASSADGLRWTSYPQNPVLKYSDTISLAQDPASGEYLAFHKRPTKVRGFSRRSVWLARSRDFQDWSEPELVLAADAEDDAWATEPGQRSEIYNMSVYPHAAGFLGLPTIFRVTRSRRPSSELTPGQSPDDGPIDVQLATSSDGRTWERTQPRRTIIPRGAPGSFDGGAILGVSSTVVHFGDQTWIYYTAVNTTHGGPMPPKRLTIGRAAWRRHGLVSLDGAQAGRVETKPLRLASPVLLVNADAGRGQLRVALLATDGSAIAGRRLQDCEPLQADATQWKARWRSGTSVPIDRPVRAVVEMTSARLFSLSSVQ